MGTPSSPGWAFGYVPTPGEWNNTFAGKVDFPAPVNQGGTGAQTVQGANGNLQQRSLINASNVPTLATLSNYGVQTSTGGMALPLPAISSVQPGDWIDILDVDFAANTNPFNLVCSGDDQLTLWGVTGSSATFNIAGTRVRVVANAGIWSVSTW